MKNVLISTLAAAVVLTAGATLSARAEAADAPNVSKIQSPADSGPQIYASGLNDDLIKALFNDAGK